MSEQKKLNQDTSIFLEKDDIITIKNAMNKQEAFQNILDQKRLQFLKTNPSLPHLKQIME